MKFCRYCDGMIVWGTEVCPHCGEILKVTQVDDLDFITGPAAAASPRPSPGPAPDDDDEDDPETVDFEALDIPPETAEMPVLKPMGEAPPVMKPIPAGPTVVKPIRGRSGAPVVRPLKASGKAPGGPPVMKPMPDAPGPAPVLSPIDGGAPTPPAAPVEECPLCAEPMVLRGGACRHCHTVVCVPCLMRANGMRAGRGMEMNRVRWGDRSRKMGADRILCPHCGEKGVELV